MKNTRPDKRNKVTQRSAIWNGAFQARFRSNFLLLTQKQRFVSYAVRGDTVILQNHGISFDKTDRQTYNSGQKYLT